MAPWVVDGVGRARVWALEAQTIHKVGTKKAGPLLLRHRSRICIGWILSILRLA